MPTEVGLEVVQDHYAGWPTLASMIYLERNDFKELCHLGPCLISAKDGSRPVLVWVDICTWQRPSLLFVPLAIVARARESGARLDVLKFEILGSPPARPRMSHTMNVLLESS